ncbi:MAG: hypothetical protein L3K17_00880 [Thermoplasmata archaeon]|nr:hypothetical protein [Thermoplasmata archaeon]
MSEPAARAAEAGGTPPPESAVDELARQLGVAPATAQQLYAAGYATPAEVRALADETLRGIGLAPEEIQRVRVAAEAQAASPTSSSDATASRPRVSGEKIVERWMDTVRKAERPKRRTVTIGAKDSTDVLRKWVDGDDRAMEQWIHASEVARPVVPPAPVEPVATPAVVPTEPASAPAAPATLPAQVLEREETVVRWLTDLLDRVKSDQFDPHSLLQEVQDLQRQLFEERAKRKQLDDEVEHVKRGSIAVIKYVRSHEAKTREQAIQAKDAELADLRLRLLQSGAANVGSDGALQNTEGTGEEPTAPAPLDETQTREIEHRMREEFSEREQAYVERETDLRRRAVQLEAEIRSLRADAEAARGREALLREGADAMPETLNDRASSLEQRERDLTVRENELRAKFEEIRIGAEEVDRKRGPLAFKEKELGAWEQQLQTTKQALELEARRLEQMRQTAGPADAVTAREKDLEDVRNEVTRKEEELQARETLLHRKMEDLEKLQRQVAEGEAEQIHTDVVQSARETKVASGVRRLDDLLFGGFPIGSQLLVNGPTHTGKDVLARLFIAEGLKLGIPAIWVVTDKTYTQIHDEMTNIFPAYPQFEARGLVRYVDLYSRSLGVTQADASVRLLSPTEKNAVDQIALYTNQFSQDLKERAGSYRLVFESVSTVTAYLDTNTTFRFLQPFVGRRKLDNAAAYYILETGMHTESDLQTLEHMMDGSINLKVDQLKTFLSIKGIGEAQSRAWVGYTFSKKSFSLGSFSLDHIR